MVADPPGRRDRILQPGWKRILRREPVVDRHNNGIHLLAELPARAVVRIQITKNPAATMKIDDRRMRPGTVRSIDPDRQIPQNRTILRVHRYGPRHPDPVLVLYRWRLRAWRPSAPGVERVEGMRATLWGYPVKPAVMEVNCQVLWLMPLQFETTPPPGQERSRLTAQ